MRKLCPLVLMVCLLGACERAPTPSTGVESAAAASGNVLIPAGTWKGAVDVKISQGVGDSSVGVPKEMQVEVVVVVDAAGNVTTVTAFGYAQSVSGPVPVNNAQGARVQVLAGEQQGFLTIRPAENVRTATGFRTVLEIKLEGHISKAELNGTGSQTVEGTYADGAIQVELSVHYSVEQGVAGSSILLKTFEDVAGSGTLTRQE